jgi:hypothetical protein
MTITQTIEIPPDRRITLEVPRGVPVGKAIIAFTPVVDPEAETALDDCPICIKHRDPITGEPLYNAETRAAIAEGDAIMRGEIPAKRFSSLDEMWEDLEKHDPDLDD